MSYLSQQKIKEQNWLRIHKALHEGDSQVRLLDSEGKETCSLSVLTSSQGLRYVKTQVGTFMEQNPRKTSRFAQMAREGHHLTWVIREGPWGFIQDGTIKTP